MVSFVTTYLDITTHLNTIRDEIAASVWQEVNARIATGTGQMDATDLIVQGFETFSSRAVQEWTGSGNIEMYIAPYELFFTGTLTVQINQTLQGRVKRLTCSGS